MCMYVCKEMLIMFLLGMDLEFCQSGPSLPLISTRIPSCFLSRVPCFI